MIINLSPYEKDRIITPRFGQTEMGRDLLAEDYILKQITASLIYPESKLGKEFWKKVYAQAQAKYGTTNIPINTFNKVWIIPDKAVVYENKGVAFVLESHLKVMLEEDYLSITEHSNVGAGSKPALKRASYEPAPTETNQLGSQITREIVIPALTREVNEGKNFAQLRQVFYSLILATWYKKKIKYSILNKIYSNRKEIKNLSSPNSSIGNTEYIYQQYLKAFKKGVYNYIKEEPDPINNQTIPRKYFSGGVLASEDDTLKTYRLTSTTLEKFETPNRLTELQVGIDLESHAMKATDIKHFPSGFAGVGKAKELIELWRGLEPAIKNITDDTATIPEAKRRPLLKLFVLNYESFKSGLEAVSQNNGISEQGYETLQHNLVVFVRRVGVFSNPTIYDNLEIVNELPADITMGEIRGLKIAHGQPVRDRLNDDVDALKSMLYSKSLLFTLCKGTVDLGAQLGFKHESALDLVITDAEIFKLHEEIHEINNKLTIVTAAISVLNARLAKISSKKLIVMDGSLNALAYSGNIDEINRKLFELRLHVMSLKDQIFDALAGHETLFHSDIALMLIENLDRLFGILEEIRRGTFSFSVAIKTPQDLNELLRREIISFKSENNIPLDFVEGVDLTKIPIDASKFDEVFVNLLNNAKDAMKGIEQKKIVIETKREGESVVITVSNNGLNVSPEILGNIFNPHFTTKEKTGGKGLGLAISQEIISAHDGTISATTEGNIFTVTIRLPATSAAMTSPENNVSDVELQQPNDAMKTMASKDGGINLNPAQMSIQVENEGEDFKFNFNGSSIDGAEVSGASFTILQMAPVTNLPQALGINVV